MLKPEEAAELGLAGTQEWKEIEAKIDSVLCAWMANPERRKPGQRAAVRVPKEYVALVKEKYGTYWQVASVGQGFYADQIEMRISLSEEQEHTLTVYNTKKRDNEASSDFNSKWGKP